MSQSTFPPAHARAPRLEGERVDQVGGVLGGVPHGRHAGAVLGCGRLEQRPVAGHLDVRRQQPRFCMISVELCAIAGKKGPPMVHMMILSKNAVVLEDVPPDHVAVGIPARIFPRDRDEGVASRLAGSG